MATLAVQKVQPSGLAAVYVAAAGGGDNFPNEGGHITVHVKNGGTASIDMTVDDRGSVAPAGATTFAPDVTVAVPAGQERFIGPFDRARFNDPATNRVSLAYSAVTSVTVAVIEV